MNLNPCPYCEPYIGPENATPILVETSTVDILHGQALECGNCGIRAMTSQQGDDEITIKFWNDLTKAIKQYETKKG